MIDSRQSRLLVGVAVLVLLLLSGGLLQSAPSLAVVPAEATVAELALEPSAHRLDERPQPIVASEPVRRPVSRGPPI